MPKDRPSISPLLKLLLELYKGNRHLGQIYQGNNQMAHFDVTYYLRIRSPLGSLIELKES